jgi:hypothetical protein
MTENGQTTEVKFVRADGKELENKPLVILKPGTNLNEGDKITGIFKKKSISEKYGTPGYIFQRDADDVLINGCGSLNKQMENVSEGELVQVEYRGKKAIADGKWKGTMSHLFTVYRAVDAGNDEEAG